MKKIFFLLMFLSCGYLVSQEFTGQELLEKSIHYHDPTGQWKNFSSTLTILMKAPQKSNRTTEILIDLEKSFFSMKAVIDNKFTGYLIENADFFSLTKNKDSTIVKHQLIDSLSIQRATLYRNYYTYLYGLPMKLKDKGTIIDKKVIRKKFKNKEYLVVKATYEKELGNDSWYFYFNPKTYAMEVYQFFHDEKKNDGEYILLSDEIIIQGIKMPKNRAWFTNKKDTYLATDFLIEKF